MCANMSYRHSVIIKMTQLWLIDTDKDKVASQLEALSR